MLSWYRKYLIKQIEEDLKSLNIAEDCLNNDFILLSTKIINHVKQNQQKRNLIKRG